MTLGRATTYWDDRPGEYHCDEMLRCPMCLTEIDQLWEFGWPVEDGRQELNCPQCDTEFAIQISVTVTYTSPRPSVATTRDEWVAGFGAFVSGHNKAEVEEVPHSGPLEQVRIRAVQKGAYGWSAEWSGRWCDDDGTPLDFRQAAYSWLVGLGRWYV